MKKARLIDKGIPVGNWYDKYKTKNPIGRYLVARFLETIKENIISITEPISSILEIGCGEGFLASYINSFGIASVEACDFSETIINVARNNFAGSNINFFAKDIYDFKESDMKDLIICCEVLEHLEYPEKALKNLVDISGKYCLLSVPNEPLWRFLNLGRFKYIAQFGNTPGHINHWSSKEFCSLVSKYFDIMKVNNPLPWTVVLCKRQRNKRKILENEE
ncbi:MAG: class I SAM-dependent methyltransferase [Nitrospirota bacterium]